MARTKELSPKKIKKILKPDEEEKEVEAEVTVSKKNKIVMPLEEGDLAIPVDEKVADEDAAESEENELAGGEEDFDEGEFNPFGDKWEE